MAQRGCSRVVYRSFSILAPSSSSIASAEGTCTGDRRGDGFVQLWGRRWTAPDDEELVVLAVANTLAEASLPIFGIQCRENLAFHVKNRESGKRQISLS